MVALRLALLGLAASAASPDLWSEAYAAHPDPIRKDAEREYFVVHTENDPRVMCDAHSWTLEGAFPILDHWLISHVKSHPKRSLLAYDFGAHQVYNGGESRVQKRAPLPLTSVADEFNISDPLFKDQWFIYNEVEQGHDMNVVPVWRRGITGHNITVAIVDDGLDYDHPDFAESFSAEGSWDYNLHQNLPKPLLDDDTHGTRCAGEVAAGVNGVCGVGLAPGAKVAGIRILSGRLTHDDEARALIHRSDINDIYSCSWGPQDDGKTIEGPPALVRRAELAGIETGRDGKGSIYVVASGNGDYHGDNCNYDGYTNSIYSITVSAVDRHNRHPYYSESCSANLVATYSSNRFDKITTSDRLDPVHPEQPKCTNGHTGTSAAAPIAAAVFALVLEQRPDLTWRDLQYLVRETAQKFDIEAADSEPRDPTRKWMETADGHHYHNAYGYGLLDADKIVKRAESWKLVKPQSWYFLPTVTESMAITPHSQSDLEVSNEQWAEANMDHIEHVRIKVSYQHTRRGDLWFRLRSPAGIVSELAAPRPDDLISDPVVNWEFMSVVHWSEKGAGKWSLQVLGPEGEFGIVKDWQLKLFGQAKDVSLVKKFSEVWDQYEPPASVVYDPIQEATATTTASQESPETDVPSTETDAPNTPTDIPADAPVTATADASSSTPTSSTTSVKTFSQPVPILQPLPSSTDSRPEIPGPTDLPDEDYSDDEEEGEKSAGSHSLKYYIVASVIGLIILSLIAGPIIYTCYIKQRLRRSYEPVEDEFELTEFDDLEPGDEHVFEEPQNI